MSYNRSFQACLFSAAMFTLVTGFSLEDVQHRSQRLDGSELITERVKNFLQCTNLCVRRSLCKSVNYNTITRECTSNYHDLLTSLTSLTTGVTGVVFAEKRSMSQNGGVCENSPCEDRNVCVQLGSDEKCFTQDLVDCGVPDVPNGWFQFGSTSLGSKASIECDEYFRFFGSSRTAECEVTGLWKGINGKCSQVEWRNKETPFTAAVPAPITEGWNIIWKGSLKNEHFNWFVLRLMHSEDWHVKMIAKIHRFKNYIWFQFASKLGSVVKQTNWFQLPLEREYLIFKIQLTANVFPWNEYSLTIYLNGEFFFEYPVQGSTKDIDQVKIEGAVTIDVLKFIYIT